MSEARYSVDLPARSKLSVAALEKALECLKNLQPLDTPLAVTDARNA